MEQQWTDLPHSFGLSVQDMAHITHALESYVDVECKGDCLHLLAMFLSDVAPTWRSQVFMLSLVSVTVKPLLAVPYCAQPCSACLVGWAGLGHDMTWCCVICLINAKYICRVQKNAALSRNFSIILTGFTLCAFSYVT